MATSVEMEEKDDVRERKGEEGKGIGDASVA